MPTRMGGLGGPGSTSTMGRRTKPSVRPALRATTPTCGPTPTDSGACREKRSDSAAALLDPLVRQHVCPFVFWDADVSRDPMDPDLPLGEALLQAGDELAVGLRLPALGEHALGVFAVREELRRRGRIDPGVVEDVERQPD